MKIISAFFSLMLVMTPAWAGSCNNDTTSTTSSKDGMNANSSQEKDEKIEDNDT